MKYYAIKEKLEQLTVFGLNDLYVIDPAFRQATLYDWVSEGRIIRLRNNRYVFSDFKPWGNDFYLLSNRIYQPSYVSLELALNHYGIIPELVVLVTAVSTLKTQVFENTFGKFQYQTIAPDKFFGYCNILHHDRNIQIATLEKAILDYLYFNHKVSSVDDFSELRWNQEILRSRIDWSRFESYLIVFNKKALVKRVSVLRKYLKE